MNRTAFAVSALLCALASGDAAANKNRHGRGPHVQIGLSGGRLGAQISSMTEELRAFFGAPTDAGVLVGQVEPDSPAAKAGVKVGDVIVEVDGDKVDSPTDVLSALGKKGKGATAQVVVVRDKRRLTLTATLRDAGKGHAFGMNMDLGDMDMDMGMGFFGTGEIEKLQKRLDDLQKRLERLEGRAK